MDLTNSLDFCQKFPETITLNEQTNYRLMEIGKIKDWFNQEIHCQQNLTSKLGKYLTCFDYTNKILTAVLTALSGTNNFAHVKGRRQLIGLISSVFSLITSLSFGIIIKLQQETKLRKKHNKLLYLAKHKLDCVEMLISKAAEDGIIDHKEFTAITKEKKDYDSQKNEGDMKKLNEVEII